MSDHNPTPKEFAEAVSEDLDLDSTGAVVPDDHPRAPDNEDDEIAAQREAYKESRPDPRDADNVPKHECDDPDAPWMN